MTGGGAGEGGSGRGRGNPRERKSIGSATPVPQPRVKIHETPPGSQRSGPALDPNMPDDLTKIRRIDRQLAEKLVRIGITHYQQIADWTANDVSSLSAALGLGRTVYQHNWIEQAAKLARKSAPSAPPAPAAAKGHPDTAPKPAVPVEEKRPATAQHEPLPDIRALVSGAAAAIGSRQAPRLQEEPTAASEAPEPASETTVPFSEPLTGECMSSAELQQLLAASFASITAGAVIPAVALSRREPTPLTTPVTEPTLPPEPAAVAAPEAEVPVSVDAPQTVPKAVPPADELTLIDGLPQYVADRLYVLGITRFSEISAFDADDVAALSIDCSLGNQINQQGWLEQAAVLASGQMTKAASRIRRGEPLCLVAYPAQPLVRDARLLENLVPPVAPAAAPALPDPAVPPPARTAMPPPLPTAALSAPAHPGDADEENTEPLSFGEDHSTRTGNDRATKFELPEEDPLAEGCIEEEAEVTIMPRRRTDIKGAAGLKAEEETDFMGRDAAVSMPGTLKSKLVRATDPQDVNAEDYAAYHTDIEEAAVEIITRQTPDKKYQLSDGNDELDAAKSRPNSAAGRFFRALRGR
jgi:predicted flap endonuclease-1-like 5' DNA nuclease